MHFTDTYLPRRDGVVTSLRTLRQALARAGHHSVSVVPRHPAQPEEPDLVRLPALGCGVADLRLSRWLVSRGSDELVARLAGHRPDLVHVHTPGPTGLLGVLLASRLGVPLVQTYHTDLHAYADAYRVPAFALRGLGRLYSSRLSCPKVSASSRAGLLDGANRLLLGSAGAVVVPTRGVLDRVTLPVHPSRVHVVPTGVAHRPVQVGQADLFRDRYGIGRHEPVVLFVGRVNREKGVDLLISAFAAIAADRPDARLVLVGAVYEHRWLRRLLAGIGPVADRVVLTGQLPPDEVAAAYAAAQVFAFASRTDTQALVLQEAAHAGLPVALVDESLARNGVLAGAVRLAAAEPAAFAKVVLELLADPVAAQAQARHAAGLAADRTPDWFGQAMLDVYRAAGLPGAEPLGAARAADARGTASAGSLVMTPDTTPHGSRALIAAA